MKMESDMKPIYFWNEGCDSRHFTITKLCRTLKEAKAYIETIDSKRAFKIVRQDESGNKTLLERVV